MKRGRNFWDFCSENPEITALAIISLSTVVMTVIVAIFSK